MLLAHLPRYVQHLRRHPHSLLARLLGTPLGAGPKPQSAWRGGVCGRGGSWDGSPKWPIWNWSILGWNSTDSEGTQIQKGVLGRNWNNKLRYAVGLEKDARPVTQIRDCGVRGLHLEPSLSGVHSLRVARGKKVGVAEARWLSSGGCWRMRSGLPSLPTPVLRSTSSS